jgi:hypothetical protein
MNFHMDKIQHAESSSTYIATQIATCSNLPSLSGKKPRLNQRSESSTKVALQLNERTLPQPMPATAFLSVIVPVTEAHPSKAAFPFQQ